MLVIEKNYSKKYECTISIFKAGLDLDTSLVYIKEPFLDNRNLSQMRFNLYQPTETTNKKDMQVFIAVQKDILSKVIIEHQISLVSHPYQIVLDIKNF